MSLEEKNETAFSLFSHCYSIPTDESLFIPAVVKAESLESLQSLDKRLQQHEENFLNRKQMLLDELARNHEEQRVELVEEFQATLKAEVKSLRDDADEYFSTINKRCSELCLATLRRMHQDISNEEKVRALVVEIAAEHSDQRGVELRVPESYELPLTEFDVPQDWRVIKDESADGNLCRLVLDFGEVVGDFDKSFNIILSEIANS